MNVKEMTNEELISNGRAIIATGGLMDRREKEIMSELADRLETMSDKMEKLDRYVRQYGAEL
ncbi:MAG: hypothetical protein IKN47_07855 [Lachnospiraceae bacterium]|nr:hypothetical protein [Lachnospiraceae bacterium]